MSQPNLYENSGNLIMRGTPAYNTALKATRSESNVTNLREELESYSLEDLRNYFYESVDPEKEEDISELSEVELVERIMEAVSQMGGYTEADIIYELSMAKRGYPVSKFARDAVKRALQKEGKNLNMATGKMIYPPGTAIGGKRRKTTRRLRSKKVSRRNRKASRRNRKASRGLRK
jgi:predicted Ser/Thr protein kinase